MPNATIGYGALLVALGVGGFVGTGATHKTALIPAGFGAAAIGLGLLGRRDSFRARALHGAALVGLLGLAGSARGLKQLPELLSSGEVERPVAVISQSVMAGLSAGYVALCAGSFLRARR